jgi:hypothetical protein
MGSNLTQALREIVESFGQESLEDMNHILLDFAKNPEPVLTKYNLPRPKKNQAFCIDDSLQLEKLHEYCVSNFVKRKLDFQSPDQIFAAYAIFSMVALVKAATDIMFLNLLDTPDDEDEKLIVTSAFLFGFGRGMLFASGEGDKNTYSMFKEFLHKAKSGEGGKTKAKREREGKLKLTARFRDDLKAACLSGKFRSAEEAVNNLLKEDAYPEFYNNVYGDDEPRISYQKFLLPVARKIWKASVRPTTKK